ncbi:MAG: hypothetical protein FJ224_02845 [Lentisphaerae bacterium]|nr:hypothetical protein [Lentisphaerota bacterium]
MNTAAGHCSSAPLPGKRTYASILEKGTRTGAAALAAAGLVFFLGILPPRVSPASCAAHWSLPVSEYTATVGVRTGWGWLADLPASDSLCMAAIVLLVLLTPAGYALIAFTCWKKERVFSVIALAEIAVMLLAASGLLKSAH